MKKMKLRNIIKLVVIMMVLEFVIGSTALAQYNNYPGARPVQDKEQAKALWNKLDSKLAAQRKSTHTVATAESTVQQSLVVKLDFGPRQEQVFYITEGPIPPKTLFFARLTTPFGDDLNLEPIEFEFGIEGRLIYTLFTPQAGGLFPNGFLKYEVFLLLPSQVLRSTTAEIPIGIADFRPKSVRGLVQNGKQLTFLGTFTPGVKTILFGLDQIDELIVDSTPQAFTLDFSREPFSFLRPGAYTIVIVLNDGTTETYSFQYQPPDGPRTQPSGQ
jgi:hypothetical protein